MIVGTCGFGSTGSSAVSDFLLEYGNINVLDKIEFELASEVDGLADLADRIMSPNQRADGSNLALRRYLKLVERKARYYEKAGIDVNYFRDSAKKFINAITQVEWDYYNLEYEENWVARMLKNSIMKDRLIPFIEMKEGRRIKCWPMEKVGLSIRPDNFYCAAREHVNELLAKMGADENHITVLDQPFSGNNPQACFPFFDNPYAIVVDRDPRDNYIFAKTKLLGRNHYIPLDTVEDFIMYYKSMRKGQPYKNGNKRVLTLNFEELIYDYDEATLKIKTFLDLPENPNPKSIFDPSLSIANTQVFKRFTEYKEDILKIEKALPDYLFDFEKYGESVITGEMFWGKSPLHK